MRILIISPRPPGSLGGVEHVVESLASELVRAGHEVVVVAGDPWARRPWAERHRGYTVVGWPTLAPGDAYHAPREPLRLQGLVSRLARWADVVHVHGVHSILPVYAGLAAARHAPLVVSPHYHARGHTLARELLWRLGWRAVVARLLRSAAVVHAVSRVEAWRITSHYPWARGRLVVVPNGVRGDVFSVSWRGRWSSYIVYAGRIEGYKRLWLALEAAERLGLELVVAGRGGYAGRLRRLAERMGVRLRLLPPQPRRAYLELLAGARYAVNPSLDEAFSIFVAEALAMGAPGLVSGVVALALGARVVGELGLPGGRLLVVEEGERIPSWSEAVGLLVEKAYRPALGWGPGEDQEGG